MFESRSPQRKAAILIALFGVAVLLQGCGSLRKIAGVSKNAPDEFNVVNKPPLIMPPDYNLKPPSPGSPTPQNLNPTAQAINALFPGRTTLPPPASAGEQALLSSLGAGASSPDVRSNAGDKNTLVVEKGALLRDILTAGEREGSPDGSSVERVRSEPLEDDEG